MKVHVKPIVTMVARPQLLTEDISEVLDRYAPDTKWTTGTFDSQGEMLAEFMGRLCYGSFGDRQGRVGALAYLGNVMEQGHGSVLEHANWSFVVEGASRGFTHQMVRHRAGFSFSQESTHFIRYAKDGDDAKSAEAEISVCGIPEQQWPTYIEACKLAVITYEHLWRDMEAGLKARGQTKIKKIVSGASRGLLPTALCSRLGMTGNGRALRHFCALRGTIDNTLEIRLVACDVTKWMKVDSPALFQDISITEAEDGYPVVNANWRKV